MVSSVLLTNTVAGRARRDPDLVIADDSRAATPKSLRDHEGAGVCAGVSPAFAWSTAS